MLSLIMLVSHKLKCVFIHIQKTAGSSIEYTLKSFDPEALLKLPDISYRHSQAIDIKKALDKDIWDNYFKFAFVRNPWDRLSAWYDLILRHLEKGNREQIMERIVVQQLVSLSSNFEEFIHNCSENLVEKNGERAGFGYNQIDYLTDDDGQLIVDFIGRYENLESDFKKVLGNIVNKSVSLPHINKSTRKHYSRYYSKKTRDIVAERYSRDIETFGYCFERAPMDAKYFFSSIATLLKNLTKTK